MPAYLVLTFCFAAQCQTVYPPDPVPSGVGCMVEAEQQAAQWVEEHPRYILDHFRCVIGHKPTPITDGAW